MKNQYPKFLLALILCMPTSMRPEITFGDVACVAVPAAIGALVGHEKTKRAIQSEKEKKEFALVGYRNKFLEANKFKEGLKIKKELLSLTKDPENIDPDEMILLGCLEQVCQKDISDQEKQLKNLRLFKADLEAQNRKSSCLRSINQRNNVIFDCEQEISSCSEQLTQQQQLKKILELAKHKNTLAYSDIKFLDQHIKDHDEQLKEIDNQIITTLQKFENAKKDLLAFNRALASEETTRLIKGTLIGGAVGAGIGCAALGIIKYTPTEDEKQLKEDLGSNRKKAFEILGLSEDATLSEIKKRYHELALLIHPDKSFFGKKFFAERMDFVQLKEAYELLSSAQNNLPKPKAILRIEFKGLLHTN